MARYYSGVLFATLAAVCGCRGDEVVTPRIIVQLVEGKGFNISMPNAGEEMEEFKYYLTFNQEFKDATGVFCKGRVECFSPKSRFRLAKDREIKEGDTLHFYLQGTRKPEPFQMERVYEVKKDDEGKLEFQLKSERDGIQKDGLWYQLDKLEETNP